MRGSILYFLFLILGIPFNHCPDIDYKQVGFSKTILEKGLKFTSNRGNSTLAFNLSLVLLPAEVDPILEEQGRKKEAMVARGNNHVEIIFILPAEVVAPHMLATIVQIRVPGLKNAITGCKVCFAMFLIFNIQFWGQPNDFLQVHIGVYT